MDGLVEIFTMQQTLPMQMHDEQAVRWQKKAIRIAPEQQEAVHRDRLELYKQGKPFRDPRDKSLE